MSSTVPGASGGETPVQESALSSVGVTGAGERSSAAAADDAERERKREKKHKRHEKGWSIQSACALSLDFRQDFHFQRLRS